MTPVCPRWDGNYGIGVLHREHIRMDHVHSVPICAEPTRRLPGENHVPIPVSPLCGGSDQEGHTSPPGVVTADRLRT